MPIEHDFRQGILQVRLVGTVLPHEIETMIRDAVNHPQYVSGGPLLLDSRNHDFSQYPTSILRRLGADLPAAAARVNKSMSGAKLAVVVGTDVGYGRARMLQVYAAMQRIRVRPFRDPDEAMAWLAEE